MVKGHAPRRRCIGCGQVFEKQELVRLVKSSDGILISTDSRMGGRGFYLCPQSDCLGRALKRKHSHLSGLNAATITDAIEKALHGAVTSDLKGLERAGRLGAVSADDIMQNLTGAADQDMKISELMDDSPLGRRLRRDVRLFSRLSAKGL